MFFTRLLGASVADARWLPSQCAICHAWPAQSVCEACRTAFAAPAQRCVQCAQRVPQGVLRCGQCLAHPPAIDACIAAVDYAYPWEALITRFKFHANPGLAGALAALMRKADAAAQLLAAADAVLPVPLSAERLRQRGYNQALLLARALARPKVQPRWLRRTHDTLAQSSLNRTERLRNLRGAFAVSTQIPRDLGGQHLLLVDDVMTTGATVHAAASALRQAGATSVSALVLARTP
ncbi:ComF family protein [Comamonas badia]|uniref:ComF family protein n=1 Tax=Comamonas badia TaxID=265291 RepID=UPI0004087EFD|nr:ComF family protein [Comamonas badia]